MHTLSDKQCIVIYARRQLIRLFVHSLVGSCRLRLDILFTEAISKLKMYASYRSHGISFYSFSSVFVCVSLPCIHEDGTKNVVQLPHYNAFTRIESIGSSN